MVRLVRVLAVATTLLFTAAALAQPAAPPLDQEVRLTALGGVVVKAPAWKLARNDAAVAVLEQAPDPAQKKPFHVLMLAVEAGPGATPVPWDKIKDNIVTAATKSGRSLSLELGEPWTGAPGFEARYLSGSFRGAAGERVALELLVLVKGDHLVTVSLVSEALAPETRALLDAVAATVALGG